MINFNNGMIYLKSLIIAIAIFIACLIGMALAASAAIIIMNIFGPIMGYFIILLILAFICIYVAVLESLKIRAGR